MQQHGKIARKYRSQSFDWRLSMWSSYKFRSDLIFFFGIFSSLSCSFLFTSNGNNHERKKCMETKNATRFVTVNLCTLHIMIKISVHFAVSEIVSHQLSPIIANIFIIPWKCNLSEVSKYSVEQFHQIHVTKKLLQILMQNWNQWNILHAREKKVIGQMTCGAIPWKSNYDCIMIKWKLCPSQRIAI